MQDEGEEQRTQTGHKPAPPSFYFLATACHVPSFGRNFPARDCSEHLRVKWESSTHSETRELRLH